MKTQTTEFQLLALFRTRMIPHAGHRVTPELQETIRDAGADVVRMLQENHGHTLADAVALLRPILADLAISK